MCASRRKLYCFSTESELQTESFVLYRKDQRSRVYLPDCSIKYGFAPLYFTAESIEITLPKPTIALSQTTPLGKLPAM